MLLAAGKGTRMGSDLPKVCHPIGGRAMVCAVVDACLDAGCDRIVVVVGYKQELVREALAEYGNTVEFAVQDEQLGTGHAVMCAEGAFPEGMREGTDLFVLCGDGPLIRAETLRTVLERHRSVGAAGTLATSVIDDPSGYGRIELTGEYYITDVFEGLLAEGKRVEVIDAVPPEDVLSINTPEHLAEVDRIFRGRALASGTHTSSEGTR